MEEFWIEHHNKKRRRLLPTLNVLTTGFLGLLQYQKLLQISEYQPGSRPTGTASRTKANHNLDGYLFSVIGYRFLLSVIRYLLSVVRYLLSVCACLK